MNAIPHGRTVLLAAALSCALVAAVAHADEGDFSCDKCDALPEGYTLELKSCRSAKPLLYGEPSPARPTSTGQGMFVDVDFAGESAPPTRIWLGISNEQVPYYAIFSGDSKKSSSCGALGFEKLAGMGARLDQPLPSWLPYMSAFALARPGGCAAAYGGAEVAWLSIAKKWVLLQTRVTSASPCGGEDEPADAPLWRRREEVYAQGMKAYRSGDFTTAEALWRQAVPLGAAMNDLGFMLDQRGRSEEAEPWLIESCILADRPSGCLNLADLYWKTGHQPLAARAYRRYIRMLISPDRLKPGETAPTPVKRALLRASPK